MLFISYSREDQELVDKLTLELDRSEHQYWVDVPGVVTGDRWSMEVENSMKQSTAIVAIITAAAVRPGSFVRQELSYATLLDKPIYPLVVERIPVEALPPELADLQQILCIDSFEDGIAELLEMLPPANQGECVVEVAPKLSAVVHPESLEFALMSRFPMTRKITVKEEITKGHSGSKVFFVEAEFRQSGDPPSPHFVKINNAYSDEPRRLFEMAYRTKLKKYMPVKSDSTPWDEANKRIGILYGLGGARGGYDSLADLLKRNFGKASQTIQIVCDALVEWNDGGKHSKTLNVQELLRTALCHSLHPESRRTRLDKNSDSSVLHRSAKLLNVTDQSPLLDFETRNSLPNPLAYLGDEVIWGKQAKLMDISYPSGNIHGDLHVRNIQVLYKTRDKKSLTVSIIDFDTYDPDNLIFVDFANLEISIISQLFGLNREVQSRETLRELEHLSAYLAKNLDLTDEIPNLNVLSVGAWVLLRQLREAVATIANIHVEYELAFWIARMAVGLQLVRKRKPSHQERLFSLLIAADSLRHLIDKLGMSLPQGKSGRLEWAQKQTYNQE